MINMLKDEKVDDERTIWLIILFALLMQSDYDTHKLWESFAKEVKTRNRFFPESELLNKINSIAVDATSIIEAGEILYRAREYTKYELVNNKIVMNVVEIIKEELSDLTIDNTDILNDSAMNIIMLYLYSNEEKRKRVTSKIKKMLDNNENFWGYDKKNSDAPISELAKGGRANPEGISYLYSTKDISTAILEMRPQLEGIYSIATVKLIKDAKMFDFTYSPEEVKEGEMSMIYDFQRISAEFSNPNFGYSLEYVPTQYLCEYIKHMGYDGIIYNSSVAKGGTNILFFDTDEASRVYDIMGSKVYKVDDLNISISQIEVFDKFMDGK